ncbi:MAG: hypothetical protein QXQ94_08415 [Candidatus Bathyarchaeia archaeon]
MQLTACKKAAFTIFLIVTIIFSAVSVSFGLQSPRVISASGTINYWPRVDVVVDVNKVIGINNLSLGFNLDWERWKKFLDSTVQQQLAIDVGFKLVRVFDFRPTNPRLMPCIYWDEPTKTGVWNWTWVDLLTQKIFEIRAEPLFCLGYARDNIQNYIPPGMAVNPVTQLPYAESYAAYAAEWVKHFKQLGLPVRFYEIMNEPFFYFGWNAANLTKLGYFVEFWNAVARAMRSENPKILLSHDAITQKRVFDYWLRYGDDVDFLDFHKYDADITGQYSDEEMFRYAEIRGFEDVSWSALYSIGDARQKWFNTRGKWLPAIISESNFNSAWENGTDPKIQQMAGAVWLALVLKGSISKGLDYFVYFEFSSSKSSAIKKPSGGFGFGMINLDDNQPWYPYYVHLVIGSNLAIGDKLIEVKSSSGDVKSIAWIHDKKLNIILICKSNENRTVRFQGISGQVTVLWIDEKISYENPEIQTKIYNVTEPLVLNGYTVALLQMPCT